MPYTSTPVPAEYFSAVQFVVLDIETTGVNANLDKIIEVAAIKFVNFQPVSEFTSLVNPQIPLSEDVSQLTGITQQELVGAPLWETVQPEFLDFIGELPLIGHNIRCFDIHFLNCAIGSELRNPVIDTLDYSRQVFPQLPSHKLSYLKSALGINVKTSHRAMDDVRTTSYLLAICLQATKQPASIALHDCLCSESVNPPGKKVNGVRLQEHIRREHVTIKEITPTDGCVHTSSPLFGKNIVFTGSLSMPRNEAMQLAVNAGATLKTSVSRKTHYLVVGQQDPTLVGSDGMSSKEEHAYALNAEGKAQIQIISEEEFLRLVQMEGIKV